MPAYAGYEREVHELAAEKKLYAIANTELGVTVAFPRYEEFEVPADADVRLLWELSCAEHPRSYAQSDALLRAAGLVPTRFAQLAAAAPADAAKRKRAPACARARRATAKRARR